MEWQSTELTIEPPQTKKVLVQDGDGEPIVTDAENYHLWDYWSPIGEIPVRKYELSVLPDCLTDGHKTYDLDSDMLPHGAKRVRITIEVLED